MHERDWTAVETVMKRMTQPLSEVLVLSPDTGQREPDGVKRIWPACHVRTCDISQWDLREEPGVYVPRTCGLAIACNTFMCSRDPALWLRNITQVVPQIIIQDLSVCKRTPSRHCGVDTGDVARYSVSSHGVIGQTDPDLEVFDLSTAGYSILDIEVYDGKFAVLLDLRA